MPELRVLVQPMFQQHYVYFMAHRFFNENLAAPLDVTVWEILTKFTKRYTNPNASELKLLVNFYPEIDEEALQHMTLADCAVRLLLDSKTWERPTDAKHFSKACSFANKPKNPIAVGNNRKGALVSLMDQ